MKTKLLFLVLGLLLVTISCKKAEDPPVSEFSFTTNATKAPVTVTFTNTSQNAETYLWNFGDGNTSTDKNPVHIYTAQGQYTIALEAKSGSGKTNSTVQYITVLKADDPLPAASFSFNVNSEFAPCIATFTNTSINAVSYSWDFGDGTTSTDKNPVHTYSSQGQYTVVLVAKNADDKTATANSTITVLKVALPLPVVSFSFSGNTAFAPCIVTFNNTTQNATTYQWNFGDGTTSTQLNPQHLYSTGGTYNVILIAKNADGISASLTKQVVVTAAPTKVNIKQVTLLAFPATMPDGSGWDIGSAADPYYTVSEYSSGTIYYTSAYFSDVLISNLPKVFPAYTISLNSLDTYYAVYFYDNDGILTPDALGGIYFKFRQLMPTYGESYPSEITLTSMTNGISFKLLLEWKP